MPRSTRICKRRLEHLRKARKELENAVPEFEGHRKDAVQEVDNAIGQLKDALNVK